jgi:cytochrome c oxidase assembly protein subunit 19
VSDGAKRANNNGYFRNLMARDDFKNLGFAQSPPPSTEKAAPEAEKGVKE